MVAAKKAKASDKQAISKKVVAILKKRYKGGVPKDDRPVLESILYGICLEDATNESADQSFKALHEDFHDLNEVRVSSVAELEPSFGEGELAAWRALRTRSLLRFVFETYYSFEFELLRRNTLDQAQKLLKKIDHLSPFVRLYSLQAVLGSHLVPVDSRMKQAAVWMGFVDPSDNEEKAANELKSAVRKADVALFCHLLRQLANDEAIAWAIEEDAEEITEFDLLTAPERLNELFTRKKKRKPAKKPAKKTTTKKATKKAVKKVAKPAKKKTVKKKAAKKAVQKKKAKKPTKKAKKATKKKKR